MANNADVQRAIIQNVANRRGFFTSQHHIAWEIEIFSDGVEFNYRNKVEFSWFGDKTDDDEKETLDLAFFKRGGKGKVVVDGTSLAHPSINKLAIEIRDLLRTKPIVARQLKTLLIRSDQQGNAVWQLYVKDKIENLISDDEVKLLSATGGEIIYSDPKSPASRITERLNKFGDTTLSDTIFRRRLQLRLRRIFPSQHSRLRKSPERYESVD